MAWYSWAHLGAREQASEASSRWPQRHGRVAFLPFVKVCLKTKIPRAFPEHPVTLGEHLLRHRMEVGLRQRDVGKLLKVDAFTILNWEKVKTVPATRYLPRIVAFLGYDPFGTVNAASMSPMPRAC